MQSSPEAADRLARRAAALAFATQGMVFISLTTRLPRFSDRWDLSEVELSLVLLMIVLLAGAGSVVAERSAHRSDSAAPCAPGCSPIACRGPGAVAAAPTGPVFVAGARGVRRGAGRRRRHQQHAGGRRRAPLRPHDPAVVPRRLDLRRHHRRRATRWPPRTLPLWTAAPGRRGPARWPSPRRTSAASTARPSPRPHRSPCRGGRSCWSGSGWCSSTWSTPRRRPGDRPSSTTSCDAPQSLVALATLPYLLASLVRAAGRRRAWCARYGAVLVLRTGAVVASLALLVVVTVADLAGRGPRLHPARRRRLGDRAAELLGRGPDRRRRTGPAWTR